MWPGRGPRGFVVVGVVVASVVAPVESLVVEPGPKTTAIGCPSGPVTMWPGRGPLGVVVVGVVASLVVLTEPPDPLPVENVVIWNRGPTALLTAPG